MTNPDDKVQPELKAVHTNGYGEHAVWGFDGLTKREWFAGLALQGVLAHPTKVDDVPAEPALAGMAVLLADALITRLNEKK